MIAPCLLGITLQITGHADLPRQLGINEAWNHAGNVATAENLNSVYMTVRPRLLEALVELDRIVPPFALVPLHDDVRQLMVLRIDAQALVIEGFTSGDGETMYAQAESKLAAANGLVVDLNTRLCTVDQAIKRVRDHIRQHDPKIKYNNNSQPYILHLVYL